MSNRSAYEDSVNPSEVATEDASNPPPPRGNPLADVPLIRYVAIDVSSAFTSAPINGVAIDHTGQMGFYWLEQGHDPTCFSAVFKDGPAYPGGVLALDAGQRTIDGAHYYLGRSVQSVNASGQMAGLLHFPFPYPWIRAYSGSVEYWPHSALGAYGGALPTTPYAGIRVGNNGLAGGILYHEDGSYGFTANGPLDMWYGVPEERAGSNTRTQFFGPIVFSPGGCSAGTYSDNPEFASGELLNPVEYAAYDGFGLTSIGALRPRSISDNGLILGDYTLLTYSDNTLCLRSGGTTQLLTQLLPPEYRGQIRFPRYTGGWINDQGDIVISSAEVRDASDRLVMNKWVQKTLLWKNALGLPDRPATSFAFLEFPDDVHPAQLNNQGDFSGYIYTQYIDPTTHLPAITPPIAARVTDVRFAPVDIDKGFDPPMKKDVDPAGHKDEEETWTSVSRKEGGKFIKNENIKLIFTSEPNAKSCRVVVRDATKAPITVKPEFPDKDVNVLTIEGIATKDNYSATDAWVEVWDKSKFGQPHAQPLKVLNVTVLPERNITYRVWYLKDPQLVDGKQDSRTQVPAEARKEFANLEKKLKTAFFQACIDFEEADPPEEIESDYDRDGNGVLQINNRDGSSHTEFVRMLDSEQFTEKMNVVVVRGVRDYFAERLGGVAREAANKVFVFTEPLVLPTGTNGYDRIQWICAHEIGHALGLSTRNRHLPSLSLLRGHDSGPFPSLLMGLDLRFRTEGLMIQHAKDDLLWMRHEDWRKANNTAGNAPFR
jgi:hypothetical protein